MPVEINFSQIKQNINLITLSQKTVNRLRFSQKQEVAHRKEKLQKQNLTLRSASFMTEPLGGRGGDIPHLEIIQKQQVIVPGSGLQNNKL